MASSPQLLPPSLYTYNKGENFATLEMKFSLPTYVENLKREMQEFSKDN